MKEQVEVNVKRIVRWTKKEDTRLTELVTPYLSGIGTIPWSEIAKSMDGRASDQCAKRWSHTLDPTLVRGPFTAEEDALILREYGEC